MSGRLITAMTVLSVLLWASVAAAQTPAPPTSVEILILPPTGDPTTIAAVATAASTISAGSPFCNLASSTAPPTPLLNPSSAEFVDPFTAGKVCRVPLPPMSAVPAGIDYRTTAVFIAATCEVGGVPATNCRSPRSAVGVPPFSVTHLTPPVAPTGLGVRP